MSRVRELLATAGLACDYYTDVAAIAGRPPEDGLFFLATPVTEGFRSIRERARCVNVQLVLDDGSVGLGDCLSVIRSGSHERHGPLVPETAIALVHAAVKPRLLDLDANRFRPLAELLDGLEVDGRSLHPGITYGLSQAILSATAAAQRRTMTQVLVEEYGLEAPSAPVPIFACADSRQNTAVDQMIMGRAGVLPHGGFTTVDAIGKDGHKLLDFVEWLVRRIRRHGDRRYCPIVHLDVYGTVGEICNGDTRKVAEFLHRVAKAALPFRVRVEDPIAASGAERSRELMSELVASIDDDGQPVEIVADEYCNTKDDIRQWADDKAAHMIHVKLPDLGSLTNAVEAILHCHQAGIATYVGGTMNDTEVSARATVHLALAVGAAQVMAKPGACPDVSIAVTANEMSRTLAFHAAC